ncbi:salviol synthase-like [Salvia miltiorrhiza]|uniref:salviol synthase-like n=1 Tax=Salvia miltiorrhiza TaxID=226208 RepID=UPI0025AC9102|nr:salviol synthase-like [Salvia miltiorrhiza]
MELNTSSTLIALLSFLFLFIFLKYVTITKSANRYSHIPTPKTLPLIGNLHLMLGTDAPHRLFRELAAKHGPLMHLQLGEIHFIIVSSVDLAKQVLKIHDINFANRPPGVAQDVLAYNMTDVVAAPYGDYWRLLRKICTLELLSTRRVQSFRSIREEENLNLCRYLASCGGSPANLSEKIHLSSYDVITRAAVGTRTTGRVMESSVISEISEVGSGFMTADFYPSVRSLRWITIAPYKIQHIRRKLDKLFDSIIEEHKSNRDKDAKYEDFVDVLLQIQKDGSITTDNIKAVLVDVFSAGTGTSATATEWAMTELMKNPSTLTKAQEEVRRVFDDKGYVDEDKFEELKYLKLIIKETLRFHPPTPLLIPRINTERCEINGYEIPAGTSLIVNAWALGRDPEYWNDPEKFIPERFEESAVDFKGNDLQYLPFGSGRRMCPGIIYGLANVEFILATLLYHFDWKLPKGMKIDELDVVEAFGSSLKRKNPLLLIPVLKRPLRA